MGKITIVLAIASLLINLGAIIIPCVAIEAGNKHHVVGGDQGWDASTNISSWSANKNFHVGDIIWFTYAAPHEGVMELKTKEEFDSCKTSNPIKMYTEGLNQVMLDSEGSRFFTSTNPENCHKGLKVHVKVLPMMQHADETAATSYGVFDALAEGPSSSHAKYYKGWSSLMWFILGFIMLI